MNIQVRRTKQGERRYRARVPGMGSRTFDFKADAKTWGLEQERRRSLGELYVAPAESFGAELDGLLSRETGLRPKTEKDRQEIAKLLSPFRAALMSTLRRAQVEDEIARIARRAPRQAQRALALTKRVVRSAKARGQAVDEQIMDIPAPRHSSREGRALGYEEQWEIAGRMPDYIRRIVPVAGLTGLRQGELFDLLDSDLDLEAGTLSVRGGKTKAARRTVHLPRGAVRLLREQLLARPNRAGVETGDLSSGARTDGQNRSLYSGLAYLVFPTLRGKRWSATNFMHRHFRPAVKAAGFEGFTFHMLRHSFTTSALQRGAPIAAIAKALGHVDGGALLLRKYGHLQDDAGAVVARAFDFEDGQEEATG